MADNADVSRLKKAFQSGIGSRLKLQHIFIICVEDLDATPFGADLNRAAYRSAETEFRLLGRSRSSELAGDEFGVFPSRAASPLLIPAAWDRPRLALHRSRRSRRLRRFKW